VEDSATVLPEMLLRFEGIHLPNAHFLVDGFPMPAHIVTIALYLYHNWEPLQVKPLLIHSIVLVVLDDDAALLASALGGRLHSTFQSWRPTKRRPT